MNANAAMLIGGHFIDGANDASVISHDVVSPVDGSRIGKAPMGDANHLNQCISAAHDAYSTWKRTTRRRRQDLLRAAASGIRARRRDLAEILVWEIGKPIQLALGEVDRASLTFDAAADALASFGLEQLPPDLDPRGEGHRILTERVPLGAALCVVPYNWPLNLAAHKIAPALAVGNTVVLKPSPLARISSYTLARLVQDCGAPHGVINAWDGPVSVLQHALDDQRIKIISFTGSDAVGWDIKSKVSDRRVLLELGGDAYAIVLEGANLDWAAKRLAAGAFAYSGQTCISVQHVMAQASIYADFRDRFVRETEKLKITDPRKVETVCGPMISEAASRKVMELIDDAVRNGARIVTGAKKSGSYVAPTILEHPGSESRIQKEEAFGPVVTLDPCQGLEEAVAVMNRSRFGIQCGVFTRDLRSAFRAFELAETGGVIVNDYPTLRFDTVPYGGVRRSGIGREGVRYAMDEMTELKSMVIRPFDD